MLTRSARHANGVQLSSDADLKDLENEYLKLQFQRLHRKRLWLLRNKSYTQMLWTYLQSSRIWIFLKMSDTTSFQLTV